MSKEIKLNKVELKNVKNVGVLVVEPKVTDARRNNPGRPVNKKSARYKRLAKQAKYALALSKFTQGDTFQLSKEESQRYRFSQSKGKYITNVGGCIISTVGGHVCNIDYVGRTKATGYTFILGRKINTALNLKTLVFIK